MKFRVIGPGRAGGALALALTEAKWENKGLLSKADDPTDAAHDVNVVFIATPDAAIAAVAAAITPVPTTLIVHLAGSLGLEVLEPHARRAAIHPVMTLPDAERGAARLRGAWFAVAAGGDPQAATIIAALAGHSFAVADNARALYHATAAVAANHVVALLGQVERLAAHAGVPASAFFALARAAVDNCEAMGARRALTGPVARGDRETVARHLAALPADERSLYEACVAAAERLVRDR